MLGAAEVVFAAWSGAAARGTAGREAGGWRCHETRNGVGDGVDGGSFWMGRFSWAPNRRAACSTWFGWSGFLGRRTGGTPVLRGLDGAVFLGAEQAGRLFYVV